MTICSIQIIWSKRCAFPRNGRCSGPGVDNPTPEFESPPPNWTKPYLPMLGLCRTDGDCWSNDYDSYSYPIGAGLCIRQTVANRYSSMVQTLEQRSQLGRTGQGLGAGEDTDMAMTACDMGLGTGRFMPLNFVHLIPGRRLTLEYLLALREGMMFSHIILNSFRPKFFPPKPFLRSVTGYLWRILKGQPLRTPLSNCCMARRAQGPSPFGEGETPDF